jgi:two-component system, response regulator PhcR
MKTNKDNILYIDNEVGNTLIFKNLFDNYYNIFTSQSEAEGLNLIERHQIELVIVNKILPQMAGLKFLKMARLIWTNIKSISLWSYSYIDIEKSTNKDIKVLRFTSNPFVDNYVSYEDIINLIQKTKETGFSYN